MYTKEITLQSGRTITLAPADLYELVTTDTDIPNEALIDITDLAAYGGMISLVGSDESRHLDDTKRVIRSKYEIAALCCHNPSLALRGTPNEGDLTTRDLTMADLDKIYAFFQNGGSDSVPATPGNES